MKISILTVSLLLTGSLYAFNTHHISAIQEGIHAVKLLDKTLQTNLTQKLQENNNTTQTMVVCTTEADKTMQEIKKSKLPAHVKISIASLDSNNTQLHATDLKIMKKYQKDIKKKTAAAMMITTVKVGDTTRVYKPLVIDSVWLECHDDKSAITFGDFKGVIISEVSKH